MGLVAKCFLLLFLSQVVSQLITERCFNQNLVTFVDFTDEIDEETGESVQLNQAQAETTCTSQGATLVKISSLEQHNLCISLRTEGFLGDSWIGVRSFIGGNGNPANFAFVGDDQQGAEFFQNVAVGEFPWAQDEPNNFLNQTEDCVTIFGANFPEPLWNDENCNFVHQSLFCEVLNSPACIVDEEPVDDNEVLDDDENDLNLIIPAAGGGAGGCVLLLLVGYLLVTFQNKRKREKNALVEVQPKPKAPSNMVQVNMREDFKLDFPQYVGDNSSASSSGLHYVRDSIYTEEGTHSNYTY